jgi:hypothetical protein
MSISDVHDVAPIKPPDLRSHEKLHKKNVTHELHTSNFSIQLLHVTLKMSQNPNSVVNQGEFAGHVKGSEPLQSSGVCFPCTS